MRRAKRNAAKLLSAAMAVGMMAGMAVPAAAEEESTNIWASDVDTSEPMELKMYLIGDRTPDFDEVYGKINEILEEKLNCTLSVDFLSWGEHDTKYSLLFSGGEDFDLIFTASSWCHYEQTVALGGFAELTEEDIQTYAPGIWDVVPEMAWDQAKIDGKVYMVPNYSNEFGQDVLAVRGDLMEEYGIDEIKDWDSLMAFYKACAENGMYASLGGPWYQYFQEKGLSTLGGAPKGGELVLYNTQDPEDTDLYYILDWDGFADYCKQMKELADMGAWSSDVLNSSDERQTGLLTGRTASMVWNLGSCLTYAKQANKENPDVYDLAMLGIEGKHWEAVGDDQYKVIDESGYGVSSNCNWGWNNANITRTEYIEDRTVLDDKYDEMKAEWEANIKPSHVLDGFTFDNTNVASQVAAVEANIETYYNPLVNGLVDDVDATIEQFRAALESAGIQDVLDELERQKEEFIAAKAE